MVPPRIRSMEPSNHIRLWAVMIWAAVSLLPVAFVPPGARSTHAGAAPPGTSDRSAARIERLIHQLGDDDFARREQAERDLAQLGLAALDALLQARWNDDIEIATRAYRLVRRVEIEWARASDPPQVRELLQQYSKQPSAARTETMSRLAALDHPAGLVALARLSRFEPSETLSKEAALAFLHRQQAPGDVASATKEINRTLGTSTRPATNWIRRGVTMWRHPEGRLDEWRWIVDDESDRFVLHPGSSSRHLMRKLHHEHAIVLWRADHESEARDAARRYIDMLDDDRVQLMEAADWFVERGWSDLAERLYQRFDASYRQNPDLFFRLAEARRRSGDHKGADKAAEQGVAALWPGGPQGVLVTAIRLENDGYYRWAEFLLRRVAPTDKPLTQAHEFIATRQLAELLHELQRDDEAADILRRLVQRDAKPDQQQRVERMVQLSQQELAARADYFAACHFERTGDRSKQREALERAVKLHPNDIEVLIAAYHASKDDRKWRGDIMKLVDRAVQQYRESIRADQEQLSKRLTASQRRPVESHLAQQWNQVAWLVANTEGDMSWALDCARSAIELQPTNAAFLDTLARCYFANANLDQAIRRQRKAVSLMPHSLPLQRQLEFFLSKRAAQDAAN